VSLVAWAAGGGALQAALQHGLAAALSASLATPDTAVQVTRSAAAAAAHGLVAATGPAVSNGTALFLRLLSPSGSVSPLLAAYAALFDASAPGKPALPATLAQLAAAGLPGGAVYGACMLPSPPPPVAQFADSTLSQPIAFNIPYAAWKASSYDPAVQSAVAEALGVHTVDVQVQQLLPGSRGGIVVRLSIATASTSSETGTSTSSGGTVSAGLQAPRELISFLDLFSIGGDGFNTVSGDAAVPLLLQKLTKYGLPVTHAYYGDQPAAGPTPP